jgi:3D (Asp-Asp-Asp) domain-containing protein
MRWFVLFLTVASAARAEPASHQARPMRVTATAYCQGGRTQSGVPAQPGIVAADPRVLPVGSTVKILDGPRTGVFTVLDTGADIKGRRIDIYIPSCARARKFGRRTVRVIVLRRGGV